ncbi:MAG: hypothetical protein U9Q34_02390 [Elusimicrobiota bacterium]|nr:hypothetical protein [Elusimicrobiota bacterium]
MKKIILYKVCVPTLIIVILIKILHFSLFGFVGGTINMKLFSLIYLSFWIFLYRLVALYFEYEIQLAGSIGIFARGIIKGFLIVMLLHVLLKLQVLLSFTYFLPREINALCFVGAIFGVSGIFVGILGGLFSIIWEYSENFLRIKFKWMPK